MFCDACGTTMAPGQIFCGSCGKRTGVAPGALVSDGRVAKHIKIIAALWAAVGTLFLLGALVLLVLGFFPLDHLIPSGALPAGIANLVHALLFGVAALLLLFAAAHFFAAWGLLHHAGWARILTIVFAFLHLLQVPLGTALGVYTIWVLMGPGSEQEYASLAPSSVSP
jgi:hypothetical protein